MLAVVTQPDRPSGRSQSMTMPAVKQAALAHKLPVFQPERIRRPEAIETLKKLAPEIMVVVGYGQILPQSVIDIAPRGIVNVHASLLPQLRGAAPIQWCIVNGDRETGVTTMQIDAGLDTGGMLLKARTAIGPDEDAIGLGERLAQMGASLLIETLEGLEGGTLQAEPQNGDLATHAPILKREDGRIDWTAPALSVHNLVRGMQPWPGAHTIFRGRLLHIWLSGRTELHWAGVPGTVRVEHEGIFAAGGDGRWIKLIEVQAEGRKRMSADEFARGQRVADNEKFGD